MSSQIGSPLPLRDTTAAISKDSISAIVTDRVSPSSAKVIALNSTPRKSPTIALRIIPGVPPTSPLTIADSAARCAGSARSSTTQPSTQLPSAMTLPERSSNAKPSPSSRTPALSPSAIRNTRAAVQWSCVAPSCGLVKMHGHR